MSSDQTLQVIFVEPDGHRRRMAAREGQTLMQLALDSGVPGIDGLCGGDMCCATCVVRPAPAWIARLTRPGDDERTVLEGMSTYRAGDRLGCQIRMEAALDGLEVQLP
jgi:ferredoxin, 2Fe-2S